MGNRSRDEREAAGGVFPGSLQTIHASIEWPHPENSKECPR
nr:MAG TPA: hypothetical protein [Caudoviricetes sp.]